MKLCPKCNEYKKLTDFHIKNSSKDGHHNKCKLCVKNQNNKYYEDNKFQKIKYASEYQKQEKVKEYQRKYHKDYFKKYYLKNKKNILDYGNQYSKNRYKNDPSFKILILLRSRFNHALIGGYKIKSITELIGCTIEECKIYLEKQFKPEMSWDNHGIIWEIDHIKPCASFNLTDIKQQQECFHYSNLQPLFKSDNRKKSNKKWIKNNY